MPDRRCSIEGCEAKHLARGWCQKHYMRWYTTGTTDLIKRERPDRTKRTCSIVGCQRSVWSRDMCNLHYTRWRRADDPGPAGLRVNPKGAGCVRSDGYRVIQIGPHPLASKHGQVLEHRAVLYDAIGPEPRPCHHCGLTVHWDKTHPAEADALVVDHLDFDRSNNDPANLVPSCGPCNARRSKRAAA